MGVEIEFIRSFLSFASSFIAIRGGWVYEDRECGCRKGGWVGVRSDKVGNQGVIR